MEPGCLTWEPGLGIGTGHITQVRNLAMKMKQTKKEQLVSIP